MPTPIRLFNATAPVGRHVFSCCSTHRRIAIVPGQDLIPAPTNLIQGRWTETGGRSVSQDPGFGAGYENPARRLVQVTCAIHCEDSKLLSCQMVQWGLFDDCRISWKFDRTRRHHPPVGPGSKPIEG